MEDRGANASQCVAAFALCKPVLANNAPEIEDDRRYLRILVVMYQISEVTKTKAI